MWIKQNDSILLRDKLQDHAGIGSSPYFIWPGDGQRDTTRRGAVVNFHFGPVGKVLTADDFHLAGNRQVLQFAKMLNRRQEDGALEGTCDSDVGDLSLLLPVDSCGCAAIPKHHLRRPVE